LFHRLVLVFLTAIIMSCGPKDQEPEVKDEKKIDSLLEVSGEKIKDVNEGVEKGYEESKDEIKEGIENIKEDSL
ncbi:MAG: hypothetical protein ACHQFW_03975, partial [Chitinophagales bacterium]